MDEKRAVAATDYERYIDLLCERIFEKWDEVAGLVYQGYLKQGRGVMMIDLLQPPGFKDSFFVSGEFVSEREREIKARRVWRNEWVVRQIKEYDARVEFLCVVVGFGATTFLRITTPPGYLSPREVYRKGLSRGDIPLASDKIQ
jgi:hypothetical protein